MDAKKVERINKLAKVLKDTGLASTMDKAVEMAQNMVEEGEESIKEMTEKGGKQ